MTPWRRAGVLKGPLPHGGCDEDALRNAGRGGRGPSERVRAQPDGRCPDVAGRAVAVLDHQAVLSAEPPPVVSRHRLDCGLRNVPFDCAVHTCVPVLLYVPLSAALDLLTVERTGTSGGRISPPCQRPVGGGPVPAVRCAAVDVRRRPRPPTMSPAVRLRAADIVVVLDFSLWRCAWRALRHSCENRAFGHWLVTYRRRILPRSWWPSRYTLVTHGSTCFEIPVRWTSSSLMPELAERHPMINQHLACRTNRNCQ
jgi:hypothetical protein